MRIIAGALRRRSLHVPRGQLTRPSTDRVREALFSLVTHRVQLEGTRVLDLFAGTGALGIEAISRGAAYAVFVEKQPRVLSVARKNAEQLGILDQCVLLRRDAVAYLSQQHGERYDLIMADPPYALTSMNQLPAMALPHLNPQGIFVLEHDKRISFARNPQLVFSRPYGRTIVSIFAPDAS